MTRSDAFNIALTRGLDHDGHPGVLGKCDLVEVYRHAPTSKLAIREVKHHTVEVLAGWLRAGVLATELLARRYCRAGAVARSEARCCALSNGAGDRLLAKLVRDPEYPAACRIWTGAASCGYPYMQPKMAIGGTAVSARRAAVELAYGPIPEGVQVYSLCGNTLCLEPLHQGVRPQQWCVQRAGHPSGIFCGASRINFEAAQQIRAAYQAGPRRVRGGTGVSLAELANQHGISISAVRQILTGQTWRRPDEGGGA